MADDKDRSPKNDPMERVREASLRLGVPFEDATEEKKGQRTLIFGFGRRRAREKRGNEERS